MVALSGVYLHAQFGPAKAAGRSACSMSLLTDPGALNAGVEVSASIAVLKAKSGLETQSHCRHGACLLAVLLRRRGKASQNQVHNRPDYVPVGDFVDTE